MTILNMLFAAAAIVALSTVTAVACRAYFFLGDLRKEFKLRYALNVVREVVQAAEQLAFAGHFPPDGSEKKNAALHMLTQIEPLDLDPDLIDFLVEAAVFENVAWTTIKDDKEPSEEEVRFKQQPPDIVG